MIEVEALGIWSVCSSASSHLKVYTYRIVTDNYAPNVGDGTHSQLHDTTFKRHSRLAVSSGYIERQAHGSLTP